MTPQPEVQQVDRDAAANLLGGATPDGLLDGRQDTLSLVQTLARHRAAAFEAGRAEGVREAAEVADREAEARHRMKDRAIALKTKFEARDHESMAIACVQVATAIRALSKEPTK